MKNKKTDNKQYKTVVITGAGSGLGRTLAYRFYETSIFNVCLIGRNKGKLLETAKLFDSKHNLCIPCDIRNYQEVNKAFKKIKNTYKKIDVLINNAGIFKMIPINQTSPKIWDNILKTNTYGTFYCTREAVQIMKRINNGGRIINILSIVAEKNLPFNSAYAASKYAVRGLMNSLREECKDKNIYISNILPSKIDTDIWNKKDKSKSQSPEELADIIYCLSTKKTSYATDISLLPIY